MKAKSAVFPKHVTFTQAVVMAILSALAAILVFQAIDTFASRASGVDGGVSETPCFGRAVGTLANGQTVSYCLD
jgi:hypothetical protein